MPNTSGEWLFWVLSVFIVGFIMSIFANLITPGLKSQSSGLLQRVRLRRGKYYKELEELSAKALDDPFEIFIFYVLRIFNLIYWIMGTIFFAFTLFVVSLLDTLYDFGEAFFNIGTAVSLIAGLFFGIILAMKSMTILTHFSDFARVYKNEKERLEAQMVDNQLDEDENSNENSLPDREDEEKEPLI